MMGNIRNPLFTKRRRAVGIAIKVYQDNPGRIFGSVVVSVYLSS
jgi:hypothetical protein